MGDLLLLLLVLAACLAPAHGVNVIGIKCAPNAVLDGPCPEPGACLATSTFPNCVTWEVTSFTLDPTAEARQHHKRTACPSFDGEGGHFVNDTWATNDCATLGGAWLSPDEMHFRLRGRHVIISGDSMQRQIFMRSVWHLRGFTHVVEHFYHRDAIYARNATHDLFWTSWPEHFGPEDIKYHYHKHQQLPYRLEVVQQSHPSGRGELDNPLVIVQFVWDVGPDRTAYEDVKMAFKKSGTLHGVYAPGIHYWRKEDCTNTTDVQSLVEISQDGKPVRHTAVYYITTPDSRGDTPHDQEIRDAQHRRNAHFRALAPQFQGRILPLDKMATTGHFRNTDGLHYGCKYDRDSWRSPVVTDFKAPPEWKQPGGGDCRDLMNLNVVQMIAASCCQR